MAVLLQVVAVEKRRLLGNFCEGDDRGDEGGSGLGPGQGERGRVHVCAEDGAWETSRVGDWLRSRETALLGVGAGFCALEMGMFEDEAELRLNSVVEEGPAEARMARPGGRRGRRGVFVCGML